MKSSSKNRPCPECRKLGRDKTGNHLYLMRDGVTWTCSKPHHGKYYERDGAKAQLSIMDQAGLNKPTLPFINELSSSLLEDRRLNVSTLDFFGIKVEHSEESGEIVAHYYPSYTELKLTGYKHRQLPKQFSWVGTAGKMLFGQNLFPPGGKRIIITGGELDAVSAYQMLQKKFSSLRVACVSSMKGENMASIRDNQKYIDSFDSIFIAVDMDEAGRQFTKELVDFFGPEKTLIMELPEKDVSDCLSMGKEDLFISAFFNASSYKPSGIVTLTDIEEDILKPSEWGLSYPFPSLTRMTYGLTTGSVIGIGAGPGAGKTSFIRQIQSHLIFEHKEKIALFSLEESPKETGKRLVGSLMKLPIHLPDCKYNIDRAREILYSMKDYVYMFDNKDYHSWSDIQSAIRYFRSLGVKYFFIDPLSALHAKMDASEANTFLSETMIGLEMTAKTLDCSFFHVNHLNNPSAGKDHGNGGRVTGSQFSGSRAQWKYSTDMIGLERDQLSEDEVIRNTVRLVLIKNRLSGECGSINLKYNKDTGLLGEILNHE